MKMRQIQVKAKLMSKIKRVVQMKIDFNAQHMQDIVDFFCIDIDDLKSENEINRVVNYHNLFQSDFLIKSVLFLLMITRLLFVENHKQ